MMNNVKTTLVALISIMFLGTLIPITSIKVYAGETITPKDNITITDAQGLQYQLDNETKTASVSTNSGFGDIVIPKEVVSNGQVYAVTRMLADLKSDSNDITSVSIPDSIQDIRLSCFLLCCNLKSISVDKNNSVYSSENGVLFNKDKTRLITYPCNKGETLYTIPSTVSKIDFGAFYQSRNLNIITIPKGVTNLSGTFFGCASLTNIFIPSGIDGIDKSTFDGCTNLNSITVDENNVTYASENGILFDKEKTSIIKYPINKKSPDYIIPNTVVNISASAFEGCSNLINLTIPNTVTNIGMCAFKECTNLSNLVLPEGITNLNQYLFIGCTNLGKISIPSKVTNLTLGMFNGCINLNSIDVDKNNSKFESTDGVLYDKGKTSLIVYPTKKALESFTIPSSVKSIGYHSFFNCTILSTLIIPESVTSIQEEAFQGCTNLSSIVVAENNSNYLGEDGVLYNKQKTEIIVYPSKKGEKSYAIPSSVTEIKSKEFNENQNLTSLLIPSSISSIISGAFIGCNSLDTFNVAQDNSIFTTVNGVIFNKEKTTLISYPANKIDKSYTIPNGVTSINIDAFKPNKNLTTIIIPSSVSYIDSSFIIKCNAFSECTSLEKFIVDDNNNTFSSEDGVLFNKKKTDILIYPCNKVEKSYTIPSSVESIYRYAFCKAKNLSSIVMSNNVKNIGQDAFYGCTSLINLTIPSSVTCIGKSAVNRCTYLNEYFNYKNYYFPIIRESGDIIYASKDVSYKYVSTDGILFSKEKLSPITPVATGDSSINILVSTLILGAIGLLGAKKKRIYRKLNNI